MHEPPTCEGRGDQHILGGSVFPRTLSPVEANMPSVIPDSGSGPLSDAETLAPQQQRGPVSHGRGGRGASPLRSRRCSGRLPFSGPKDVHAAGDGAPRLLRVRGDGAACRRYVRCRPEGHRAGGSAWVLASGGLSPSRPGFLSLVTASVRCSTLFLVFIFHLVSSFCPVLPSKKVVQNLAQGILS